MSFLNWNMRTVGGGFPVGRVAAAKNSRRLHYEFESRKSVVELIAAHMHAAEGELTDRAGSAITAPSCPSCGSVANDVGESEGAPVARLPRL